MIISLGAVVVFGRVYDLFDPYRFSLRFPFYFTFLEVDLDEKI